MRVQSRAFVAFAIMAVGACSTMGCELLVDFNRALIDGGVEDAGEAEGGPSIDSSAPPVDGATDSGGDSTVSTPDAGMDTGVSEDAPSPEDTGSPDTGSNQDSSTGDSGGSDSGGGDSGGVDSGFDAGFDAGPVDSGFDAGVEDSGFDAGPADSGFDAGVVDAGFDAGPAPQITSFAIDEDAGCASADPGAVTLVWTATDATSASMTYTFASDAAAPVSVSVATSGNGFTVTSVFGGEVGSIQCGDTITLSETNAGGTSSQTQTF